MNCRCQVARPASSATASPSALSGVGSTTATRPATSASRPTITGWPHFGQRRALARRLMPSSFHRPRDLITASTTRQSVTLLVLPESCPDIGHLVGTDLAAGLAGTPAGGLLAATSLRDLAGPTPDYVRG